MNESVWPLIPEELSREPAVYLRHVKLRLACLLILHAPAADVGETISVAASDLSTKFNSTNLMAKDGYYTFSNLGSCVDLFAPGEC